MATDEFNLDVLYTGVASYVIPSVVLALVMVFQQRNWALLRLMQFAGVLVHEMLHFLVGLVTMAKPTSMSLIPTVEGGRRILGSVGFAGLNWWNSWITALAPLLALPLIYGVASWRLSEGLNHFQWGDIIIWVLFAPQWVNCWPSRADWRLVLISWPLAALLASVSVVWIWSFS